MPEKDYYHQECPTCGRRLRIRVAYQGRRVRCRHCRAEFEACDPHGPGYPPQGSGLALLKRADALLSGIDGAPGAASQQNTETR